MSFTKNDLTRRDFLIKSVCTFGVLSVGLNNPIKALAETADYPNGQFLIQPSELAGRLEAAASGCPASTGLLLDTLRLVDFRREEDYSDQHLLTAVNLWYPEVTVESGGVPGFVAPPDAVAGAMSQIGISSEVEAVIYGDTGNLYSGRLFWILDYYGQPNIKILNGGLPYWLKNDMPMLTQDKPEIRRSQFQAVPNSDKIVDADWLLANLKNPDVVVIDARDPKAFEAGHIPGAISKSWKENINWEDESFLPAEQLRERFEEGGVSQEKTVISYCQTGVAGAQNYFVLRLLGYPDVRLYDGSWADWTSDSTRPVEK